MVSAVDLKASFGLGEIHFYCGQASRLEDISKSENESDFVRVLFAQVEPWL